MRAKNDIKFKKKITGPTLFSDIEDQEMPGWLFIHEKILKDND
jgi:hypothetical protein